MKISYRQSRAIVLLLQGKPIEKVAKSLRLNPKTIYRWLETDKDFREALEEAQDKVFEKALENLKAGTLEAVKTLRTLLLEGHKDTARLGSAKTILELAFRNKEIEELENRIEALEMKINEIKEQG